MLVASTKEKFIAALEKLPEGTKIFVRSGDDAYTPNLRVFEHNGVQTLFIELVSFEHRNFPERCRGVKEIKI
jgi:hypothetical protein